MIDDEIIVEFLQNCWQNDVNKRLNIDQVIDFITSKHFVLNLKSIDFNEVVKYLNFFGDEYNILKTKLK